jgi:hypothetical protein
VQIPDKGFLSSANSGMTGFLGFFDVVADKMRRGASGQQIPDTGLLSSANSGMTGCYGLFGSTGNLVKSLQLA